jgi:hypothetical protein
MAGRANAAVLHGTGTPAPGASGAQPVALALALRTPLLFPKALWPIALPPERTAGKRSHANPSRWLGGALPAPGEKGGGARPLHGQVRGSWPQTMAPRREDGVQEKRWCPGEGWRAGEGMAPRRGDGVQRRGRRSGEGLAPKGAGGAQEREWRQREGAALRRGNAKGRGRRSGEGMAPKGGGGAQKKKRAQKKAMVPRRRLELPRPLGHRYLKPARLPVPPPGHTAEAGAVAPRPGCVNAGPISCAPLRA